AIGASRRAGELQGVLFSAWPGSVADRDPIGAALFTRSIPGGDMLEEAQADETGEGAHRPRFPFIARQFPPFTQRQWRGFGISTTAGFFDNYDGALLSLALKQIQRGLGIAEGSLGGMLSLIRLGYLGSLFISPLADVFGRRRLLLYTIVGYTLF